MTHDPRDRVEVLRDGVHVTWARKAVTITWAAQDGRVTVRGTPRALAVAGVDLVDDGRGEVGPDRVIVGVEFSPVSLAPRASGKSTSTARRTTEAKLRLSADALARLDAAAERVGLSRSAYVEKFASELPPAIVNG